MELSHESRRGMANLVPMPMYVACWKGAACIALALVMSSFAAAGQLSGAVFTTLKDGSRVNANLYPSKADVYLDGGPGPGAPASAAGLPKGDYYFQVTDPAGKVLLSEDPVGSRKFHVNAAGVIDRVYTHASGVDRDHAELGALTVQLMPYSDTPNPGGEYKVWATPVEKLAPGGPNFGFANAWSKTDSFKIDNPKVSPSVEKFTIEPPPDVTAEQTSRAGTPVALGSPTVVDTWDPAPVVTNNAPAVFPLGTTVVTWTVTDRKGNVASATQKVMVVDTTPPVLTVPAQTTVEQATAAGTKVEWTCSASDICDANVDIVCAPPSGTVLPLGGPYAVTCTATDDSGNRTVKTFPVTVVDTTPPDLTVHEDITVEQTEFGGTPASNAQLASFMASASATDICDAAPTIGNDAPEVFPLGTTPVTFTARDSSGNRATGTAYVTVQDTTPPVLSVPAPITVRQTTAAGAVVDFTCTATDICDAAPVIACVPPSGSVFPRGETVVTATATDESGNGVTQTFTVTVLGAPGSPASMPILIVPTDITVEQIGRAGTPATEPAIAQFLALALGMDTKGAILPVTNDAPAVLPLGATAVTFTATNSYGNTATGAATVTVVDTTPPTLTGPAGGIAVGLTTPKGTPATYPPLAAFLAWASAAAAATDICDANPTITNDAPEVFPYGLTVVTYTATDFSGNRARLTITVHVGLP